MIRHRLTFRSYEDNEAPKPSSGPAQPAATAESQDAPSGAPSGGNQQSPQDQGNDDMDDDDDDVDFNLGGGGSGAGGSAPAPSYGQEEAEDTQMGSVHKSSSKDDG